MANIPLKSFTFPGLPDKYTTPVVDNTLTQAGEAADAKKTGDEIASLKNDLTQGTFPVGNAENAEQLTSTVGIEDTAPYLFRTSGGSNDIGDREDVKKIVGVSVPWNQLVDFDNIVLGTIATRTDNNAFSVKYTAPDAQSRNVLGNTNITNGHKFLFTYNVTRVNQTENCFFNVYMPTLGQYSITGFGNTSKAVIRQINDSKVQLWQNNVVQDAEYDIDFTYQITDLTQMLGTSIADYVYSLETATAGAGVAWLKKHFPAQFDAGYQAYDAGSMQSVSGLTEHKMVGFNQWDEQYEVGAIDSSGVPSVANNAIRSKNFCRCVAGATYYMTCGKTDGGNNNRYYLGIFWYDADKNMVSRAYNNNGTVVAPDNAMYFKITTNTSTVIYGATYNHDICINLHWDGEKDGQYEPYKEYVYALDPTVVIRGIPKVDANGNLYYDGDEYLPDGTVNRRYGIVDLGSLNWAENITNVYFTTITDINPQSDSDGYDTRQKGLVCQKYVTDTQFSISQSMNDKTWLRALKNVYIKDTAYSDVVSFKTAMSGVYLVYELATPTIETADPYQATQIVDDFGTEEYVLSDGAFPVPVGHVTMYQNNLRAKLEMSPESPDGDGLYVVQQESGENTYVPLASTATIQDILTRLTALENA